MLAENAVLCQKNYDGFLCYFFCLIITISCEINIQSFVTPFSLNWAAQRERWMGWTKNCLKTGVFKKYNLADWGP